MKNHLTILLFLSLACFFFVFELGAQPLIPEEERPLLDHLTEVNKEWRHQAPDWPLLTEPVRFCNDDERIQAHLQLVERILRERIVEGLTVKQHRCRIRQLDRLRAYWQEGVFPRNTKHGHRRPYFIDDYGTACAVAYLALQDGQQELVGRIRQENNVAYIEEMVYPELPAWAEGNGLSLEELAWIQPGYPPQPLPFVPMGNGGGVEGHVNAMHSINDGEMLVLAGNFSKVDGVPANSIIGWNGQDWITLGEGLAGEVFALEYLQGYLYAGGDFHLPGAPEKQNLAYWDGDQWIGVQEGDMQGKILALKTAASFNVLYVGGDFQKANGQELPYLAQYDGNEDLWTNTVTRWTPEGPIQVSGALAINGPVRTIEEVAGLTLFGGDFTQTAPNADPELVNQLETNYLAYWDYDDWVEALHGNHGPVYATCYCDGDLYVGGRIGTEASGMSVLRAGVWFDYMYNFVAFGDSTIHQIERIGEDILISGGFYFTPDVGTFGSGMITFGEYGGNGYAYFDNTVRAIAEFQGEMVIAGDFEEVNGEPFHNLVLLGLATPVRNEPSGVNAEIRIIGDYLHVGYDNLPEEAGLFLYNIQGQLLKQISLPAGSQQQSFPIESLTAGTYVCEIRSDDRRQVEKLVK